MGYRDEDLLRRVSANGIPVIRSVSFSNLAYRNTKDESIRYCAGRGVSWEYFDQMNRAASRRNIANGVLVANLCCRPHDYKLRIFRGSC